jgi:hypothetical protein
MLHTSMISIENDKKLAAHHAFDKIKKFISTLLSMIAYV